jgi:hypothetical protein
MLDEKGNEYVLLSTSELKEIKNIEDKTAFEALENHVHLVNNLKKEEFERLIPVAKIFAKILAHLLKQQFPDKNFYTYVSLHLKDSMIIRFHQKWENEEPYYNPMDFSGEIEKVFMYQI